MSDMDQRNALFLTPELWAEVFAHVEMRPDNIESNIETDWDRDDDLKHQLNQKYVHQVKLVCKHFKDIHASRSSLVQRLYVGQAFAVTSLPSLLMWLHERKSTLQIFQSTSATLLVDIVLSGLVSPDSSIKLVDVWNVSATSIPMIATFTSLGKCALVHGKDEHLDLSPLGGLPKLHHLVLQGRFKELHHLRDLTQLECSECNLGIQEFAPTLHCLQVADSSLLNVQAQSLLACTALTQLYLTQACFQGNGQLYWDMNMSVSPTNIALPTQLQALRLSTGSKAFHHADLSWISNLIFLQELSIFCPVSHGDVLQQASPLTKLTSLEIWNFSDHQAPIVNADIEWHRLHALQSLYLFNMTLQLGSGFADILQLCHLRVLRFPGCKVEVKDNIEAEVLAALTSKFAVF